MSMQGSEWTSLLLIVVVCTIVVLPRLRNTPGLGALLALIVAGMATWLRPGGLERLGLYSPDSWSDTITGALAAGGLITLVTIAVFEPLIEHWTGEAHDWSLVRGVRESWATLLQLLVLVWLLAATLEEVLFRGFLMLEVHSLVGSSPLALTVNVVLSSAVFGMAHSYQGRSGVLSTGVVGLFLGTLFVASGFNLWLPIFTHGFVDTLSLLMMRLNWDETLRARVRQRLGLSAPGVRWE